MAERGYLEMVWDHVLVGAELKNLSAPEGKLGTVLGFAAPTFRESFGSDTLQLELRQKSLLTCQPIDGDGARVPLSTLHETHALAASPPVVGDPRTLLLRAAPRASRDEPWSVVSLLLEGDLGAITTAAGKRLTQMKLASVAQKRMFATNGIATIAELKARRDEALESVHELLVEAGFEGRAPFWTRSGADLTHAVELVNSRWNTFAAVSFHFRFHVVLGDLRGERRTTALSLHDCPRASVVRTSAELLGLGAHEFSVTQTTTATALAPELRASFDKRFLPWLDTMTEVDSVASFLPKEHPAKNT